MSEEIRTPVSAVTGRGISPLYDRHHEGRTRAQLVCDLQPFYNGLGAGAGKSQGGKRGSRTPKAVKLAGFQSQCGRPSACLSKLPGASLVRSLAQRNDLGRE